MFAKNRQLLEECRTGIADLGGRLGRFEQHVAEQLGDMDHRTVEYQKRTFANLEAKDGIDGKRFSINEAQTETESKLSSLDMSFTVLREQMGRLEQHMLRDQQQG